MRQRKRSHRLVRRGLSLVECMISLSISACLLAAITAAFSASTAAISANDQFTRAAQACRVTSDRILREVRLADAVAVTATTVDIIHPDGTENIYAYDANLKRITLTVEGDSRNYVLASDVQSASFAADVEPDPKTEINRVVRVTLNLAVTVGNNAVTLGGCAAPRRAITY